MSRTKIISFLVSCMFLILGLGLFNLEAIHGRRYRELSNRNRVRLLPQSGARGKILDSEGNVIADNKLSYDVMVLPQDQDQLEQILGGVSDILGVSKLDLRGTYRSGYAAPAIPVSIAKNIDIKQAIALEELKTTIPSIIIQPKPLRHYPQGRTASHVLGYISEIDHWRLTKLEDYGYKTKDMVGFGGLEEKYDYYLRQEEGGVSVEVDHKGRLVRLLGFRPPANGKNIQLTLNLRIQKIAQDSLSGKKGCVIIMDPYDGAIIAMASYPDFKPAAFVEGSRGQISSLLNDQDSPLLNRAISGSYPAGSVFKPIVAAAALETRKINLNTTFICQGFTFVGKKKFACWSTHGRQDLISAIAHSCNVFFYKTGLLCGAQVMHDYATRFGLSKSSFSDLPYETAGVVSSPLLRKINTFSNWFEGDTANFSIGQGDLLVTPLQMARVIAVFANSGYLVNPYLVKGIDGREAVLNKKKASYLRLKESTIDNIREGLRRVVSDSGGTANVLSGLSISIAGKTGTAQVSHRASHAWFLGFFPFQKPKFVICVLLENGGPGYFSCLVAKQIIESMIGEGMI